MKIKFSLLFLALASVSGIKSQVVLTENFTSPFSLNASTGWTVQNNSVPTSSIGWFQGNSANTFTAYNGGSDDYYAANFNSTGANNAAGIISNWLISPTVALVNGATIEFATRTINTATVFPDRMQVYVSPVANYTLPAGATSVGTFSNLVFDVNSNLSTSTVAVLTNSTTVGYPQNWTVYTATVTGLTGTVTGRFAFRYFVTNAGPVGANSNYIGVDGVKYSVPCAQPSFSIAQTNTGVCSGVAVGLSATSTGTVSASSFTWSSGASTASTNVTPSATAIYTVFGTSSSGCVGSQTAAITVTATPNLDVPSYTICAGFSATLAATGANDYLWNTTSTLSSIVVSPSVNTVYTVTGSAAGGACPVTKTASVDIGAQLSVNVTAIPASICAGEVTTITAISAASNYSWSNGGTSATFTASPSSSASYTVGAAAGSLTNSCVGFGIISVNVNQLPVLSVSQSTAVCSGATFSASASGANTYTFMYTTSSSTSNPVSFTSISSASLSSTQFSVAGTGTNGCTAMSVNSLVVNPNPVITIAASKLVECFNSTITFTASGASTYTWSGSASGNNSTLSFPTGTVAAIKSFTVVGVSAATGCSGTADILVEVSACAGINGVLGNSSEIVAFPNPFKNELNLAGIVGNVDIYNVVGEKVLSVLVENNQTISTNSLSNGIYILKAFDQSGKELKTMKLIKN